MLRLVCDLAKLAAQPVHSNRMVISLYAVLLCEVLVAAPQVQLQLQMVYFVVLIVFGPYIK